MLVKMSTGLTSEYWTFTVQHHGHGLSCCRKHSQENGQHRFSGGIQRVVKLFERDSFMRTCGHFQNNGAKQRAKKKNIKLFSHMLMLTCMILNLQTKQFGQDRPVSRSSSRS
jgi:hypothetical protein